MTPSNGNRTDSKMRFTRCASSRRVLSESITRMAPLATGANCADSRPAPESISTNRNSAAIWDRRARKVEDVNRLSGLATGLPVGRSHKFLVLAAVANERACPAWVRKSLKPGPRLTPKALCSEGERKLASTTQIDSVVRRARASAAFMHTEVQPTPRVAPQNKTVRTG